MTLLWGKTSPGQRQVLLKAQDRQQLKSSRKLLNCLQRLASLSLAFRGQWWGTQSQLEIKARGLISFPVIQVLASWRDGADPTCWFLEDEQQLSLIHASDLRTKEKEDQLHQHYHPKECSAPRRRFWAKLWMTFRRIEIREQRAASLWLGFQEENHHDTGIFLNNSTRKTAPQLKDYGTDPREM